MTDVEKKDDSMEDILHSIRDIIAGDEEKQEEPVAEEVEETTTPNDPPQEDAVKEEPQEEDTSEEIMELTDIVEEEDASEEVDVLQDIDQALEVAAPDIEEEVVIAEAPVIEEVSHSEEVVESEVPRHKSETLLTNDKAQASTRALQKLLHNVPKPDIDSPAFRNGITIEDLVVEAIKPMLSEWLNEHLPVIVNEMVEREIRKLLPRE